MPGRTRSLSPSPSPSPSAMEMEAEMDEPRTDMSRQYNQTSGSSAVSGPTENEEEEGEDDRIDLKLIQSFASKIQHSPIDAQSRPKILIPKRGEKDFEPLQETVNLQEMMLQNSRQALFDALFGVRGASSKSMSHALLVPPSPYARLLVSRGHVLDTMGIAVRPITNDKKGKGRARIELLPEETLYLVERGSLQLWVGHEAETPEEISNGVGMWSEEDQGVRGAVEMSVIESFAAFMGKDALTWERYQAYAYLKRLGYTVQRSRRFIPQHFLANLETSTSKSESKASVLLSVVKFLKGIPQWLKSTIRLWLTNISLVLNIWTEVSYSSILNRLRFIPSGHPHSVKQLPNSHDGDLQYGILRQNPYLPFFHVWKPATPWSKSKWDLGSEIGLARQRPEYFVAVVESRETPMPNQKQLAEVFDQLPDEPKGIVKRAGPQYNKPSRSSKPAIKPATKISFFNKMFPSSTPTPVPVNIAMGALRNGDRGLIVAVNDSGNTGWVRFGRSGFANYPVL